MTCRMSYVIRVLLGSKRLNHDLQKESVICVLSGSNRLNHDLQKEPVICVLSGSNRLNHDLQKEPVICVLSGSNRLNHDLQKEPDSTVYLNVGGKRFEVLWSTLGQFSSSRNSNQLIIRNIYYSKVLSQR